eukprot:scaffold2472_cov132-Skeletonema_menzelii.AAC.6
MGNSTPSSQPTSSGSSTISFTSLTLILPQSQWAPIILSVFSLFTTPTRVEQRHRHPKQMLLAQIHHKRSQHTPMLTT